MNIPELNNKLREIIKYQVEAYGGKINPKDDFAGFIRDIREILPKFAPLDKESLKAKIYTHLTYRTWETDEGCVVMPNSQKEKLSNSIAEIICFNFGKQPNSDDIFIRHIQAHLEPDQKVCCKICGKFAEAIIEDER